MTDAVNSGRCSAANIEAQAARDAAVRKGTYNMDKNLTAAPAYKAPEAPSAIIPAKGLEDYRAAFNSNYIILGPSGCGKSTGVVIPSILRMQGNYIVTDVKSSLSKLLTPELEKNGYNVQTLDFCDLNSSCGWNPLADIPLDEDGHYDEQEIMKMAAELCPIETDDPYWDVTARNVIESLIGLVLETEKPENRNLAMVEVAGRLLGGMCKNSESDLRKLFDRCYERDHDSFAYRKYRSFYDVTNVDRTWGCIIISVQKALAGFSAKGFRNMFSRKDDLFDVEKFCSGRSCLFVNISDISRDADRVVGLFCNSLFRNLYDTADRRPDGRLPIPLNIILDDFASGFRIENFPGIISTARSRNIAVSLAFQSITMLDALYNPYNARTILNNCSIIYMGGRDTETAAYVSQASNKPLSAIMEMPVDKVCVLGFGHPAIFADKEPPTVYAELLERRAAEAKRSLPKPSGESRRSAPAANTKDRARKNNSGRHSGARRAEATVPPISLEVPASLVKERIMPNGDTMYSFTFTLGFMDNNDPLVGSILLKKSKVSFSDDRRTCTLDLGFPGKVYRLSHGGHNAGTISAVDVKVGFENNRSRYLDYIRRRSRAS